MFVPTFTYVFGVVVHARLRLRCLLKCLFGCFISQSPPLIEGQLLTAPHVR